MSGEPAARKKGFDPGAFLGIEGRFCDPRRARFVVVPVPYEKTVTFKKGTAKGPEAILEASRQVEFYDEILDREVYRVGVTTAPVVACREMPDVLAARLESVVGEILDREQVPAILGGEHSISLGAVRAGLRRYPRLSVLHFDAQGDLRDEYEGTRFGHGCVMRRVYDLGVPIVQVGIRSLSLEERDTIRSSQGRIRTFFAHDVRSLGPRLPDQVLQHLGDPVYLSFDLDGFDPSVIPATGTPEPGGLSWCEATDVIAAVASSRKIVAFDVVELLPTPGLHTSDFTAARLIYRTMGLIARASRFSEIE